MAYRIGLVALLWLMAFVAWGQQQASIVKEIVVQGNRRVSREAILAAMRTKVGQPYIQENLDRDRQSLIELGFFQAVDVRATPLEGSEWRVTVDVQEQPEIKEIRVVGNGAVKTEEILAAIQPFFKVGDVYNENSRRPASRAIQELYAKKQFGLYSIDPFSPLPESPGTLNIGIIEAKVGQVGFQGNKTTKDWVMKRLIKTRPGETFNVNKWTNDLRRLVNTQWFETVQSIEDEQRELGRIDLIADVKETRTGQFNVGLQLDPRNSLAGVVSLRDVNFRGTGQSVGLNYIQATRGTGPSVDLDYANPFFDAKDTTLRASVYSRVVFRFANAFSSGGPQDNSDQYYERRTGASLGISRPVRENLSLGVSARFENVKTENVETAGEGEYIRQDGDVAVLSLGGVVNKRDRDVDPTRGSWLRLDLEPGYSNITNVGGAAADQSILGTNTFFRTSMEWRQYFTDGPPLGRDLNAVRRVLALRVRYGGIMGDVPFFEQFFAGGSDTVRGYSEDRFWGKHQLLSTVELRYPLQKSFSIIGFVDYGGAWGGYGAVNDFTQSSKFDLHLGYGLGLSFKTPLGPIRLDLGFNEEGKSRTHFLIGTSF
ncbi:MAG: BamA/OMP85 family outer membrane protein [Fimbriimonas sp.]